MSAITTQAPSDGVRTAEITTMRLEPTNWGNAAPLALAAFAVTTFMLSMVNANWISPGVEPVVFGVALMFGGITQLIAGIIQFSANSARTVTTRVRNDATHIPNVKIPNAYRNSPRACPA
jgi:succinate-acetate transporter protein